MNVLDTHQQVIDDYAQYIRSFINISDPQIAQEVEDSLSEGRLWPQPLLHFNPLTNKLAPSRKLQPQDCCMMMSVTFSAGSPYTDINTKLSNWAWVTPTLSSLREPVRANH